MTRKNVASFPQEVKDLFTQNKDMLKELLQESVQEILEAQMSDLLNAESYERTEGRRGYRAGYYRRHLNTRVGMIELRVPQDRDGQFSTEVFERYQRSEKALVCSMMEMYVQGVSTRKVSRITEELCGVGFSAATVSSLAASLDGRLEKFARRRLEEEYPYLILDARYEKVRIDGTVQSQAVLIALGVGWDGRREVLAVELADRESASIWKDFLDGLAGRGLHGVEFVVSDDHCGIRKAVRDALPGAACSGATSISSATRSTIFPARRIPTVWWSSAGSTTVGTRPRPGGTSPPGLPNGSRSTRSFATGWRRTSRRRSPSTGCPPPITSI